MTDQPLFEYQAKDARGWDDSILRVTRAGEHVRFAVEQEKVVGGDDMLFKCFADLPADKARELARMLTASLG